MLRKLSYTSILLIVILIGSSPGKAQSSLSTIQSSKIGKKDVGITIEEAIKKFRLDTTTKISFQEEPPFVLRGITAELSDSTILYLQIERTYTENRNFKLILNKKITGIGLAFANCQKKNWGTGSVWWGMRNPYCKPPFDKKWYRKQEGIQ